MSIHDTTEGCNGEESYDDECNGEEYYENNANPLCDKLYDLSQAIKDFAELSREVVDEEDLLWGGRGFPKIADHVNPEHVQDKANIISYLILDLDDSIKNYIIENSRLLTGECRSRFVQLMQNSFDAGCKKAAKIIKSDEIPKNS